MMLDGSLAGDVGFDPLGFAKSKKTLFWMREAETKHARLAMLAAAGWPLSELWHKNIAAVFGLPSILAGGERAPSLLNGGLNSVYASGMLMMSIIIAGYLEGKAMNSGEVFWNAEKPDGYTPGNYGFDPLVIPINYPHSIFHIPHSTLLHTPHTSHTPHPTLHTPHSTHSTHSTLTLHPTLHIYHHNNHTN
jgi:hypothetical protein